MGRRLVEVPVPALALRRAEAAAALGVSVEVFDTHARPNLPVVRVASLVVYPVAGLTAWLDAHAERPITEQIRRAA